jgi:hypothetical protein
MAVAARQLSALEKSGVRLIELPIPRASTLSVWREAAGRAQMEAHYTLRHAADAAPRAWRAASGLCR